MQQIVVTTPELQAGDIALRTGWRSVEGDVHWEYGEAFNPARLIDSVTGPDADTYYRIIFHGEISPYYVNDPAATIFEVLRGYKRLVYVTAQWDDGTSTTLANDTLPIEIPES